jgi:hypothetical protein
LSSLSLDPLTTSLPLPSAAMVAGG